MNSFKVIFLLANIAFAFSTFCEQKVPYTDTDCSSLSNLTDACCMFSLKIPGLMNTTHVCQPLTIDNAYLAPYVSIVNILDNKTEYTVSTTIDCAASSEMINTCTGAPKNAASINDCYTHGNATGSCCYLGNTTSGTCYFPSEFKSTNTKRNGAVLQCSTSNTTNTMPSTQTVIVDVIDLASGYINFRFATLLAFIAGLFL